MYIEDKLFSETSGECYYSVTMTEDEYDLYSEFLEKTFNRAAYEGLNLVQKEALKGARSRIANGLLKERSKLLKQRETVKNVRNTVSSCGEFYAPMALKTKEEKALLEKAKESLGGTGYYLNQAAKNAENNISTGYKRALDTSKRQANQWRQDILNSKMYK